MINTDNARTYNEPISIRPSPTSLEPIQHAIHSISQETMKLGKYATAFEDPSQNALFKAFPHLPPLPNPIIAITIPSSNGQEHIFIVRRGSLAKISQVYEKRNSTLWKEDFLWRKDGGLGHHLKAVGQVILFAAYLGEDIPKQLYQPVSETLKTTASQEERLTVLEDILLLSALYSIEGLRKECEDYMQTEIDSFQKAADYFEMCTLLDLPTDFMQLDTLWMKSVHSLIKENNISEALDLFENLASHITDFSCPKKQSRVLQTLGKAFFLFSPLTSWTM